MENNESNNEQAESSEENQEIAAETSPNEQVTKAEPEKISTKKKYKIKVDGAELEEELDLADEESIRNHLQLSKVARKRMEESKQQKQQVAQFFEQLKNNPEEVLSDPRLGIDFRAMAEKYLHEQLQSEMLTPEQKKLKQAEEIIRQHEEQQKQIKMQEEQKQNEALFNKHRESYQKIIVDALETNSIPKNAKTVKKMAELMSKNIDMELDLTPSQLAQLVKEDYQRELNETLNLYNSPDELIKILGEDRIKAIRQNEIKKLQSTLPQAQVTKAEPPAPKQRQFIDPLSFADKIRK